MEIGQLACRELTIAGLLTGSSMLSNAILEKLDINGGAAYGIIYYLTSRPISIVAILATGANNPETTPIKTITAFAITFFSSAAATMGIIKSAYDISDKEFAYDDSLALSGTTLAFASLFATPLVCCSLLTKPEEDGYANI
jgi:hypothetical protein